MVILDAGVEMLLPAMPHFWLVTNIPYNAVGSGDEKMEYIPPFSTEFNEDGSFVTDPGQSAHPMIFLVFKQPGELDVPLEQRGCNPGVVEKRILDYR